MKCGEVDSLAELSLDGELAPKDQALLDLHLVSCPACRQRVRALTWSHKQLRAHLKAVGEPSAPLGLCTRVRSRIRRAEETRLKSRFVPLSVGAVVVVGAMVIATTGRSGLVDPERPVSRHAARLPPEVRASGEPLQVQRFLLDNFGEVRLPTPGRILPNLKLVGARLDHVADRKAALLMFDRRGARISLLVYGWESEAVLPPPQFRVRRIKNRAVVVGRHRGYNMVAFRRGPHLYSVVSDLDEEELIQMARAF